MLRLLALVALFAAGAALAGADAISPSEAALSRALEESSAAIEAARESSANPPPLPSAEDIGAPGNLLDGLPMSPRIEDVSGRHASLRALIERARTGSDALPGSRPPTPEAAPLVFVSFSIPAASLRALVRQATGVGTPLVLRGLAGDSMKETVERVGELLEIDTAQGREDASSSDVNLMIDPTLFERFAIEAVPAFVLPLEPPPPCTEAGCDTPAHVKVAGDVSLDHALAVIARDASDARAREQADVFLRELEGAE